MGRGFWVFAGAGLVQALLVVFAVVTTVFIVSRTAADPIGLLAPIGASPERIEQVKEREGLNDPLYQQYLRFLGNALRLDFGTSLRTSRPALEEVASRLEKTLQLGLAGLGFAVAVGVPIGVLSAVKRGSAVDLLARLLALVGQAVPNFWLGLMLILFFSVRLGWLPTGGTGSWKHLVLPAVTLGFSSMAAMMRLTRSGMLEALRTDFIRTARAKGLAEFVVIRRHALRHALIPVLAVLGIQAGFVLAGAVIVETVFAWPGLGRLMITSISTSDYPVVQAGVIVISASIVLANLMVDLCYRLVDPRIRADLA